MAFPICEHKEFIAKNQPLHDRLKDALEQNPLDYDLLKDRAYSFVARGLAFLWRAGNSSDQSDNKWFLAHYPLRNEIPFIVCSQNEARQINAEGEVEASTALGELEKAIDVFERMHERDSSLSDGKMGQGLCTLIIAIKLKAGGGSSRDYITKLEEAAAAFDDARLAGERAGPAYLYGALTHFLLLATQEIQSHFKFRSAEDWEKLYAYHARKRQAFYRLEHFIDQFLEDIIEGCDDVQIAGDGKVCNLKEARSGEKPLGFYFDPVDVVKILPNPIYAIGSLEKKLALMPICKSFLGAKEFVADGEKIDEIIAKQARNLLEDHCVAD